MNIFGQEAGKNERSPGHNAQGKNWETRKKGKEKRRGPNTWYAVARPEIQQRMWRNLLCETKGFAFFTMKKRENKPRILCNFSSPLA